jgi:hypothetical protein
LSRTGNRISQTFGSLKQIKDDTLLPTLGDYFSWSFLFLAVKKTLAIKNGQVPA